MLLLKMIRVVHCYACPDNAQVSLLVREIAEHQNGVEKSGFSSKHLFVVRLCFFTLRPSSQHEHSSPVKRGDAERLQAVYHRWVVGMGVEAEEAERKAAASDAASAA